LGYHSHLGIPHHRHHCLGKFQPTVQIFRQDFPEMDLLMEYFQHLQAHFLHQMAHEVLHQILQNMVPHLQSHHRHQ
jgi:hypothetical protein